MKKKISLLITSLALASTMALTASAAGYTIADFEDGEAKFSCDAELIVIEDTFAGSSKALQYVITADQFAELPDKDAPEFASPSITYDFGNVTFSDDAAISFQVRSNIAVDRQIRVAVQDANGGSKTYYQTVGGGMVATVSLPASTLVNTTDNWIGDGYYGTGVDLTQITTMEIYVWAADAADASFTFDDFAVSGTVTENAAAVVEDDDTDADADDDADADVEDTDADADVEDTDADADVEDTDADTTTVPESGNASVATVAAIVLAGAASTLVATKKRK